MNEKQIMEDMDEQFMSMLESTETMMVRVENGRFINVMLDPTDDLLRWMPDQIIDPVELVHQIEVK